jgi:hypothetical protein
VYHVCSSHLQTLASARLTVHVIRALLNEQDLGNTNFSIILPRLLFTRAHGAELVARAVRDRLGIDTCGVNKRNDVVIRDGDAEFKASELALVYLDWIGLT